MENWEKRCLVKYVSWALPRIFPKAGSMEMAEFLEELVAFMKQMEEKVDNVSRL